MKKIMLSVILSVILSACGGSGGGGSGTSSQSSVNLSSVTSSDTSSVSSLSSLVSEASSSINQSSLHSVISSFDDSSSSISSVASSVSSTNTNVVYENALNDEFGNFSRYELDEKSEMQDMNTPQGDFLVTWSEEDEGENRIITVDYSGKESIIGQFEITGDIDLSDYASGYFEFDIRFNSQELSSELPPELFFQFECSVWPCTSHRQYINESEYDVWKTIRVNAKDLVKTGLNFSTIVKSFVIRPTYNNSIHLSFSLDNIRWVSGEEPPVITTPVYYEPFNTFDTADLWTVSLPSSSIEYFRYIQYGLNVSVENHTAPFSNMVVSHSFGNQLISLKSKRVSGYMMSLDSYTNESSVVVKFKDSAGLISQSEPFPIYHSTVERFISFNLDFNEDFESDIGFDEDNVAEISFEVIYPLSYMTTPSVVTFVVDEVRIE